MRTVASRHFLLVAIVVCAVAALSTRTATAEGGLMLTPATVTLELAKGSSEQNAEFSITNKYQVPVTLHFSFEPALGTPAGIDPAAYLRVQQSHVLLAAGETLQQRITLADSRELKPGSTPADLVITQANNTGANIGVLPSIRMPLVLIKQDGAVSALSVIGLGAGGFRLSVPTTLAVTIKNSGNVITIPRGTLTITGPNGSVVRSGALNTASLAVSPGDTQTLTTPFNQITSASWPGLYDVQLSYGLGGGQKAATVTAHFFYIAWWHLAALLAAGVLLYLARHRILTAIRTLHTSRRAHRAPPKRTLLIGRDIT